MHEVSVPITITKYEIAIAEIFSALNKYLQPNRRWRINKTEHKKGTTPQITISLTIEHYKEPTWHLEKESPAFTVSNEAEKEGDAMHGCLIKGLYLCCNSLDIPIKFTYDRGATTKEIKKTYKPKVSWEKDFDASGIKVTDLVAFRTLTELKTFVKEKDSEFRIESLIEEIKMVEAKKKNKSSEGMKVKVSRLLNYVFGPVKYRSAKKVVGVGESRPAKRVGRFEKKEVTAAIGRNPRQLMELHKFFSDKGFGSEEFLSRFPVLGKKYGSLEMFLNSGLDSEVSEVRSSVV
jgi:hypothetical protein